MSEALATYVNDHLGGAKIALQELESMRDQHDDEHFRDFARTLLPEIQKDDATLQSIAERTGSDSGPLKEAGGWLLEKLARVKLGHTGTSDFRMFESLELLSVGIQGKLCLWKALETASRSDARLRTYDFNELVKRASAQYEQVEAERLGLAAKVFADS